MSCAQSIYRLDLSNVSNSKQLTGLVTDLQKTEEPISVPLQWVAHRRVVLDSVTLSHVRGWQLCSVELGTLQWSGLDGIRFVFSEAPSRYTTVVAQPGQVLSVLCYHPGGKHRRPPVGMLVVRHL